MIVNTSSLSRVHIINLARELLLRGYLGDYFTTLPASRTIGFPASKVRRNLVLAPFLYLAMRMKMGSPFMRQSVFFQINELFDRWVASSATPCDLFQHLPGCGLHAQKAYTQRFGARIVCDSGTPHLRFENHLIREEYLRWKQPYSEIHPETQEKTEEEYQNCDLITVPSTFALKSFLGAGIPAEKLALAPYGVDPSLFHPVKKQDDIFRVLFVGSQTLRKGIPYLLDALGTLKLPKFQLCLCGHPLPEVRPWLEKYNSAIQFYGARSFESLKETYSQASVLVLPSISDGFGMVLNEALACGVPIIATSHTGAPDVITDGVEGFIIPPRDSRIIREKVLYLYENRDKLEDMKASALRRVGRMGGSAEYGDRIVEAYQKLLTPIANRKGSA